MKLIYICVNVPLTINDRKFHVDFTNEYRGDIHYFGAKTFGICGKIKVNGNHTMGLLCCLQHFLFNYKPMKLGLYRFRPVRLSVCLSVCLFVILSAAISRKLLDRF